MIGKVTRFERPHRKKIAEFEKMVETSERHPATPETGRKKNKTRKWEDHERSNESSDGTISREIARPRVITEQETTVWKRCIEVGENSVSTRNV